MLSRSQFSIKRKTPRRDRRADRLRRRRLRRERSRSLLRGLQAAAQPALSRSERVRARDPDLHREGRPVTSSIQPTVNAVLADIERGEEPIALTELPSSNLIPKHRGKKPHVSAIFRWASAGLRGHKLETA